MVDEQKRQARVRDRLLEALRANKDGVTNAQLSKDYNILRYGGTLGTLYREGYNIKVERFSGGLVKYTLISEPKEKVLRPTAIEVLCETINAKGVNSTVESIKKLLDEAGVTLRFKAGTYQNNDEVTN